jgi:hypothetical protein
MLDEFSSINVDPARQAPAPAAPAAPVPPSAAAGAAADANPEADLEALLGNDDFAKELAKNMASLLGEGVRRLPRPPTAIAPPLGGPCF